MDTIGTMGLKYGLTFPSYIGIIILLVLSQQFSQLAKRSTNDCSIYHHSLPSISKILKILVISMGFMTILYEFNSIFIITIIIITICFFVYIDKTSGQVSINQLVVLTGLDIH